VGWVVGWKKFTNSEAAPHSFPRAQFLDNLRVDDINLAEAKHELLVIPHVSRRDAALYAATLSFSAACTIRNVPDKSQLPDIDHSLRQSDSHHTDAPSKRAAKRGM
jgi:hypothetical protein